MSRKQYSTRKQVLVAAALALGTSGITLADDSVMNPYVADSHAYLSSGNPLQGDRPVISKSRLTFRQTNPHGLSFNEYMALAEPNAPAWQPAPVIDKTPSSFHKDNPHGLPFSFYETLADGTPPAWQPKPVIDKTPSSFHKDNPHGLAFSFYEQYSE